MTDFFEWDPGTLSVHVDAMDAEHRVLIAKMNALHAARARRAPRAELSTLLDDFVLYTKQHFRDEESYMERIGYAGLASHRQIHEKLLIQVAEHVGAFERAGVLSDSFFGFLSFWLGAHIRGIDGKYDPTAAGRPAPTPKVDAVTSPPPARR